ncbi:MAG: hypothetical protein HYT12_02780 [Candidatus Liptonbacteria bacterium]|nr:hypothetical protein [Candidatus Liptonbacteria bacterium]
MRIIVIAVIFMITPASLTFAQTDDGIATPTLSGTARNDASSFATSSDNTIENGGTATTPRATTSEAPIKPIETIEKPTSSSPPTPPVIVNQTPTEIISLAQNTNPVESESINPLLWAMLASLTILPFGYLVTQSLKNKKLKKTKKVSGGA